MSHNLNQLTLDEAFELVKKLILHDAHSRFSLSAQELSQLLFVKKHSLSSGDRTFDNFMFETGKFLDERIRDGADALPKKQFTVLIDYFHKVESTAGHLNHLAFMGSNQLDDIEKLIELKQDMEIFDALEPGLFYNLFVEELLKSQLLDSYGRRRIKVLVEGLSAVSTIKMQKSDLKCFDLQSVQAIINRLQLLENEERLFMALAEIVSELVRKNQAALSTSQGVEMIKRVSTIELRRKHLLDGDIPDSLFRKAFDLVKLEAIYSNAILPQIVRGNLTLRQDFIRKSGLDLFYIEDLEDRYFERHGVAGEIRMQIRAAR